MAQVSWGEIKEEPWVTVRLFAEHRVEELTMTAPGGVRVLGQALASPLRVSIENDRLALRGGGGFVAHLTRARISAVRNTDIVLTAAGTQRSTAGYLEIRVRHGALQILNAMPAELYVMGVVEPELGGVDFPIESLKAQIVASRSYLLAMRPRHAHDGFDFCDGPHCQTFRGTAGIKPQVLEAGAAVRGTYLTFGGRAIPAFFHDSCGGSTAPANLVWPMSAVPYLRSVRDGVSEPYCRHAPRAHWHFKVRQEELQRCLVREGLLERAQPPLGLLVTALDVSGRAQTMAIQTSVRQPVSAKKIRLAMNRYFGSEVLPSMMFRVVRQGKFFLFEGRGWGHGVGLCQWGAIQMAKDGRTYQEILSHYYPGTAIERIPAPTYASAPHTGA